MIFPTQVGDLKVCRRLALSLTFLYWGLVLSPTFLYWGLVLSLKLKKLGGW